MESRCIANRSSWIVGSIQVVLHLLNGTIHSMKTKHSTLPSQSTTSVKVLIKPEDGSTRFSLYPQLCSIRLHTSDAYRLD